MASVPAAAERRDAMLVHQTLARESRDLTVSGARGFPLYAIGAQWSNYCKISADFRALLPEIPPTNNIAPLGNAVAE